MGVAIGINLGKIITKLIYPNCTLLRFFFFLILFREIYGRQKKGNISASEKMDTRSSGSEPKSWKIIKAVRRST